MPNRDSHFEPGIFFVTQTHQAESGRNSRSDSFLFPGKVLAFKTASKVSTPSKTENQ